MTPQAQFAATWDEVVRNPESGRGRAVSDPDRGVSMAALTNTTAWRGHHHQHESKGVCEVACLLSRRPGRRCDPRACQAITARPPVQSEGNGMLVLSRRQGESVTIKVGDVSILVVVVDQRDGKVRLGFEAPLSVEIHRGEVWAAINSKGQE